MEVATSLCLPAARAKLGGFCCSDAALESWNHVSPALCLYPTSGKISSAHAADNSFVGDSLSEQHHQIIRNFLLSSNGPFISRSHGGRPRVDMFYLNPDDDRAKHYLELAGVTEDRLKNPVSTFLLERHLLSPDEYDQVFENLAGYIPLSTQEPPHQWVANSVWNAEIHKLLDGKMTLDESGSLANSKEESTILVLSTGPHWLSREITSEKGVSDEELLTYYEDMASAALACNVRLR